VDKIRQFDISSELFSFATEEPLLFWKNLHVRTSELKKKKKGLLKKENLTLTWRSPYYIVRALTSEIHLLLLGVKGYMRRVYIADHDEVGQPHQPKFRF
jgi:hypothetical protein